MSAIGKTTGSPDAAQSAEPQAEVTSAIVPTSIGQVQSPTYLRHVRRVIRRPFELRTLKSRVLGAAAPLGEAVMRDVETIATTEPSEFAFSVAELAFRLDQLRDTISDDDALEGLEVLTHTARMYEHIFILQTEG